MNEVLISQIKEKALRDNVPIIEDPSLAYIINYLKENDINSMLEIGTAVGYSSICFASAKEDLHITTIEIDEFRYKVAKENIEKANLKNRINPILANAREFKLDGKYDCLFLDGPKAHNQQLLQMYEKNLNTNGIIIVDDVYFHGFIDGPIENVGKRLKPLVIKFKEFRENMLNNPKYDTRYLEIGDGLLICRKKD